MNLQMLKEFDKIIFEAISGSHAYGTNVPTSDIDIRGIFSYSKQQHLSLQELPVEVSDDKQDTKYYELRKFIKLASECNPNIIELLWMPRDCVQIQNAIMDKLINSRHLFISARAQHTFRGYAYAQISKAKGKNKYVNNPQPERQPRKEDFCYIITTLEGAANITLEDTVFPMRPIPLDRYNDLELTYGMRRMLGHAPVDLREYHVAALEHTSNVYRLYYYGKDAKGVFRGDDMLVCEPIPVEDEIKKFRGILIYNEGLFEQALKSWNSYWDWMKFRNSSRWVDQESGKLDYDQKNIMHCVRLLYSGRNILLQGEPIVRFTGKELQYLQDIRAGKFAYEDIMGQVDNLMLEFDALKSETTLSWGVNIQKIDDLYQELMDMVG